MGHRPRWVLRASEGAAPCRGRTLRHAAAVWVAALLPPRCGQARQCARADHFRERKLTPNVAEPAWRRRYEALCCLHTGPVTLHERSAGRAVGALTDTASRRQRPAACELAHITRLARESRQTLLVCVKSCSVAVAGLRLYIISVITACAVRYDALADARRARGLPGAHNANARASGPAGGASAAASTQPATEARKLTLPLRLLFEPGLKLASDVVLESTSRERRAHWPMSSRIPPPTPLDPRASSLPIQVPASPRACHPWPRCPGHPALSSCCKCATPAPTPPLS